MNKWDGPKLLSTCYLLTGNNDEPTEADHDEEIQEGSQQTRGNKGQTKMKD